MILKLQHLLTPSRVKLNLPPASLEQTLTKMSQLMCESHQLLEWKNTMHAMLEQEQADSTYIGHGIAIPHIKSAQVNHPIGVLLQFKDKITWSESTHAQVDVLFGFISPEQCLDKHLELLGTLAHQFSRPEFREYVRKCSNPNWVVAHIDDDLS